MKNNLLPINDDFIMSIAKSISRERLLADTDAAMKYAAGYSLFDDPILVDRIGIEFEYMWGSLDPADKEVRDRFRNDAIAAINAINLLLLTTPEA